MTTDYEKRLEEEIVALKNLLDDRTKELDDANAELKRWCDGLKYNYNTSKSGIQLSPSVSVTETDISKSPYDLTINSSVVIGRARLTETLVEHLQNLYSDHVSKLNKQPLLYRIWRKIISCLNTKKT
jgi:hypothetical protein